MGYYNSDGNHGNYGMNAQNQMKRKEPKKDMVEMDGEVLEVLPNGICKVKMDNGVEVIAYLKGVFKEIKGCEVKRFANGKTLFLVLFQPKAITANGVSFHAKNFLDEVVADVHIT